MQQPRLGLVTGGPGTVPLCGQETWVLPVQHLSHSLESLWQKMAGEGTGHSEGKGQQVPEGHSSAACPRLPRHGPGLWLAALEGTACVPLPVLTGRPRILHMAHLQEIPQQNHHLLPAAAAAFHVTNLKAQHGSTLDSSGSEHLPNHTILTLHHQSSSVTPLLP